jgi:5-methylcytosine-specific restriction endonuclease McrA
MVLEAVRTCIGCGGDLPSGSSPKRLRCESCKKAVIVQRTTAWRGRNPEKLALQRERELPQARVRALAQYKREPEKILAYSKKWKQAHPEKMRFYHARWLEQPENQAKAKGWIKSWMKAHPEKVRAYYQRWYVENQDLLRTSSLRRRSIYASSPFQYEEWLEILYVFDQKCGYCLVECDSLTMDHMIPISRGGPHTAENIIPSCRSCNSRKRDRTIFYMLNTQR